MNDKKEKMYDVVYYIGTKKVETIRRNLPIGLAKYIKNESEKDFKYRTGTIKLDEI